jgi:hypothetical protein
MQFESTIRNALDNFNQRLNQQRLFQIQNILLNKLYLEVKQIGYCNSEDAKKFCLMYENSYQT